MTLILSEIREFTGLLCVLGSGLRIGGSKDGSALGETDNPIIRNPITGLPYIPGSSVKGKIRSLLESKHCSDTQKTGLPCTCGLCDICKLFGCHLSKNIQSPSRLVFRDCQPTDETVDIWTKAGVSSEIKTEVLIDRNKGLSYGRIGPRTTERIPSDSVFHFSFSIRLFKGDNEKAFFSKLAEGFELVEKHYLGGHGSRGYGEVAFYNEDGETHLIAKLRKLAE